MFYYMFIPILIHGQMPEPDNDDNDLLKKILFELAIGLLVDIIIEVIKNWQFYSKSPNGNVINECKANELSSFST